jgi:hypothetical protein
MYIPDNLDIYDAYESERSRIEKMLKRIQHQFEKEEYGWQHYMNLQDNLKNCCK